MDVEGLVFTTEKDDNVSNEGGNLNSLTDEPSSGLWNTFSGLAATVAEKTSEVASSYQKDLTLFLNEVKDEVTEIYKENLEGPVTSIKAALPTIPTLFGPDSEDQIDLKTFGEELSRVPPKEFLLCQDTQSKEWQLFQESKSAKAPFTATQQEIIISNDPDLGLLLDELVPLHIDVEHFWKRWRFWQYKVSGAVSRIESGMRADYEEKVSPSLDAVNVSFTNPPERSVEDWDSWE